jgi:hypothetical protein
MTVVYAKAPKRTRKPRPKGPPLPKNIVTTKSPAERKRDKRRAWQLANTTFDR